MKKITSVVLAVCMLLSVMMLASCGETPESLVNNAVAKMAELESMEAEIDAEIKMNMLGIDMTVPVDMHMAMANMKSDAPVTSVSVETSMMGESVVMEVYMDGSEWAYMTVGGVSYKTSVANAEKSLSLGTSGPADMLKTFPAELFTDVEIVKNEDGSKSVTLLIPSEQFTALYGGDVVAGLTSSTGSEVAIKDVTLDITVKDGYIAEFDMAFDMDITADGKSATASVDMDIDYINAGQTVTVTPPVGYQDFPELDI